MSDFKVGEKVLVSVARRGGKPPEQRECAVVEVVPAGRVPKKKGFYSTLKYGHTSYIVQDASGERYRPVVSRIRRADGSFGTPAIAPFVEGPPKVYTTTSDPAPVAVPTPVTEYIFVVDESGSMRPFVQEMNKLLVGQVEALRASAVGEVFVTLWSFGRGYGYNSTLLADRVPLHNFTAPVLGAIGGTPLFDCAGRAIRSATSRQSSANTAYVLTVMTDGCDEHSADRNGVALGELLRSSLATDRWTHAFMVPRGYKEKLLRLCPSLSEGNVAEWDVSDAGIKAAASTQAQATSAYMQKRSVGVTRTSTYFMPNLSQVTEADLAKCTDLSPHFKRYEALVETTCRELAEEKAKKPFVIGSAFYQLTKREGDVQGYKQILLRHRATGRIFGGAEARKLIGLQMHVDAKIEPGNHGDFEIYIESTSFSRILPRGAHMLHDHAMAVPKQPTWDHQAAFAAAEAKKANGIPVSK